MDHIELWIEIGAQFLLRPFSHTLLYLLFLSVSSLSMQYFFHCSTTKVEKVHWKASPFLWQGSAEQSKVRLSSLCIDLILDFDVVFPASAQKEKLKWNEMRMSWAKEKMNWELKETERRQKEKRKRRAESRAEDKGSCDTKGPETSWMSQVELWEASERESRYRSL